MTVALSNHFPLLSRAHAIPSVPKGAQYEEKSSKVWQHSGQEDPKESTSNSVLTAAVMMSQRRDGEMDSLRWYSVVTLPCSAQLNGVTFIIYTEMDCSHVFKTANPLILFQCLFINVVFAMIRCENRR